MGNNQHLKRHAAPVSWPIKRKNITFIAKPKPGSHKSKYVTSIVVLLRDVLNYAETSKEVKLVLNEKQVLVNAKEVTDIKFPVGMFDIIEIKGTKEKFVVLFDKFSKLRLVAQKDNSIYLRVTGKKSLANKKYQLNFMNGFNTLVDEKTYNGVKVRDTIVYDLDKNNVSSVLNLKEGAFVYFYDGKFVGQFGEIKTFVNYQGVTKDVVEVEIGDEVHSTAKDYAYVIGTKKGDLARFE